MRSSGSKKISYYIQPMLTTAVDKPFDDEDWLFELKLDGYRAIAEIKKSALLLYSRNGLDLSDRYSVIVSVLKKIKTPMILDGEIVLLNEKGKPDFQKLQNYQKNRNYPLVYYVFDILSLNGKDQKQLPLIKRKKILQENLKTSDVIRYCDHVEFSGKEFFKAVRKQNLEGIIAKEKNSLYLPGIRSKQWLKIKYHQSQEAIIAGFTEPKGGRQHFGSILLAEYKKNKLEYIGNAGTGFTDKTLKEVMNKMKPLVSEESPFKKKIKAEGIITWIKPILVCEVAYSEITASGMLRHPVFKRLRPDKNAKAIKEKTETPLAINKIVK